MWSWLVGTVLLGSAVVTIPEEFRVLPRRIDTVLIPVADHRPEAQPFRKPSLESLQFDGWASAEL
jgi:hypothetical protein